MATLFQATSHGAKSIRLTNHRGATSGQLLTAPDDRLLNCYKIGTQTHTHTHTHTQSLHNSKTIPSRTNKCPYTHSHTQTRTRACEIHTHAFGHTHTNPLTHAPTQMHIHTHLTQSSLCLLLFMRCLPVIFCKSTC